ncbi:TlpA family protein disulfide reductase [Sphingobacterium thalpophilum]|uniref:TlpA family protein disulfide reductase n=1 Tax=Sphingobacterium thalpophilum TaxID=259 RepID=UPI003C77344F
MFTLILLLIKDILKTRLYRGNNLLKMLTAIFVSMFSLCSAQSVETRADAGQSAKKITRENIPYFVDIQMAKSRYDHKQLGNLKKFPRKKYRAKMEHIVPIAQNTEVPQEIMDLPVRIVNDANGRDSTTLRELSKKRLLILDFWADWCGPCVESMNKWADIQQKYNDRVQVVGLMLDYDYKAEKNIKERGWTMPQLVGPEAFFLNAYFCGTPVTGPSAWIDKNTFIGATDTHANCEKLINDLYSGRISSIPEEAKMITNIK